MKLFSNGLVGLEPKDLLGMNRLVRLFSAFSRERKYHFIEFGSRGVMSFPGINPGWQPSSSPIDRGVGPLLHLFTFHIIFLY